MLCEICGERKATKKIEVEGIALYVCEKCAKFGKEIKEVREEKRERKAKIRERAEEDILPDFAEKVREAREKLGMSREELGKIINEKESVIAKIESGKMLPNEKLAKKLEKALEIKLKGAIEFGSAERKSLPKATLGDVAEVRVKKG